jgi:hypothetical protein
MESKHAVIHIMGGLGNQLFQIVFGLVLGKRFGVQVHFNTSSFISGQGSQPSKYFDSLYKKITKQFDNYKYECEYNEKNYNYYNVNNDIYSMFQTRNAFKCEGYWQSEQHFPNMKEELRNLFDLSHPYMHIPKQVFLDYPKLLDISKINSCLVCVRRGDYLKKPHIHNPCGMTYYKKAMSYFPTDTTFFILSDDLDWCRLFFGSCSYSDKFVYMDIRDDLTSFYIGTLFSNYIIGNSTFHWWMSYFSIHENPRIIAPDKWVSVSNYETIYRSDMIIVERPVEV